MNITNKYMIISMIANCFLSVLKIVFGIMSNVKSLVADGIHSFSDLSTDLIAIAGSKLSRKPADDGHPRGHGKIEYITSLIISCFILVLGISIFKNSFSKTNTIPNIYLAIVAIITAVTKFIVSKLLMKKGRQTNNMILISSAKESYTDVYSSLLVFFVIVLSQFHEKLEFLKYCDMVGSILISILIVITGINLLKENLSLLIGEREMCAEKIDEVKKIISSRDEYFILEECMILKIGSYYEVVLKILVDGNLTIKQGHDLMDDIENDLLRSNLNIEYVTIHIEPIVESNKTKSKKIKKST